MKLRNIGDARDKGDMKRSKTYAGQHRIVIYFFVAILIPSILLGLLAFRGIKNDQALVGQQARQTMYVEGKKIADECNHTLQRAEQDIMEWGYAHDRSLPASPWVQDSMLLERVKSHPCIAEAILFDSEHVPRIHAQHIAFLPDSFSRLNAHPVQGYDAQLLETGWQFEFKLGDFHTAAQYYSRILTRLKTTPGICTALMARARLQKRLKQPQDAINTFEQIIYRCPEVFIDKQIPLQHVAHVELSQLYLKAGDTIRALRQVEGLFSLLGSSPNTITQSGFEVLYPRVLTVVDSCRVSSSAHVVNAVRKTDSLSAILDRDVAFTQRLFALIGEVKKIPVRDGDKDFRRMITSVQDQQIGISLSPESMHGYWLFILDREAMLDKVILPSLMTGNVQDRWQWQVLDENGTVLRESGNLPAGEEYITHIINAGAFKWTLLIWQTPVPLLDVLVFGGRSIYMLIFFTIMAVLIFGLIFTYQAINSEIRLTKMKASFISTVSHEFKSPLTSLRHMAELLKEGKVQPEERRQEYYGVMLEQSHRLSHLIDNLLDFSRIEEGKKLFRFEETNMEKFLMDIITPFQKRIGEEGFVVDVCIPDDLPAVEIDRHAMTQVVYNLLDNACKYSGDSRVIKVAAARENRSVQISVTDFGFGIPKTEVNKIFDRFYRVGDALTGNIKGSGLGLTLVKQIVEAHTGQVHVDSTPGKGSTFYVRIPVSS